MYAAEVLDLLAGWLCAATTLHSRPQVTSCHLAEDLLDMLEVLVSHTLAITCTIAVLL